MAKRTWVHRLSEVDLTKRTAICANCGPVQIKVRRNHAPACHVANSLRKKLARYGLRKDDYYLLLVQQRGVCAICHRRPMGEHRNGHLLIDHKHGSDGQVRGLLCQRCNVGLSWFQDDPARLLTAAIYLLRPGITNDPPHPEG